MSAHNRSLRWFICVTMVCFILNALCNGSIAGMQSGRKPAKRPESPDPLPKKDEEPPIKQPSPETKAIPVRVIWYLQATNSSSILANIVRDGCLDRLAQVRSVAATGGREINRKGAIDMAKASTDTYVLWYELEPDLVDTETAKNSVGPIDGQLLYVNYEIFEPSTGKRKTAGHIYQRPRGAVTAPMPVPRTTYAYEYLLRQAGRELADRLLDCLNVTRPPGK